jgi:hypothetical protein
MPTTMSCSLCGRTDRVQAYRLSPAAERIYRDEFHISEPEKTAAELMLHGICAACGALPPGERYALATMALRSACGDLVVDVMTAAGWSRSDARTYAARTAPGTLESEEFYEPPAALAVTAEAQRQPARQRRLRMSDTEELLDMLKCGDMRCRVTRRGRLIVTPKSRLSPAWRLAIERHKDGLVRLIDDRCDDLRPPTIRSIKRKNSMPRPDNQLLLFVKHDPGAKQPPI